MTDIDRISSSFKMWPSSIDSIINRSDLEYCQSWLTRSIHSGQVAEKGRTLYAKSRVTVFQFTLFLEITWSIGCNFSFSSLLFRFEVINALHRLILVSFTRSPNGMLWSILIRSSTRCCPPYKMTTNAHSTRKKCNDFRRCSDAFCKKKDRRSSGTEFKSCRTMLLRIMLHCQRRPTRVQSVVFIHLRGFHLISSTSIQFNRTEFPKLVPLKIDSWISEQIGRDQTQRWLGNVDGMQRTKKCDPCTEWPYLFGFDRTTNRNAQQNVRRRCSIGVDEFVQYGRRYGENHPQV